MNLFKLINSYVWCIIIINNNTNSLDIYINIYFKYKNKCN